MTKELKTSDFRYRDKFELSPEKIQELIDNNLIQPSDMPDANNPKYDWHSVGNSKYGRFMYCPNTDTARHQTMGEFYGGGIVD